jgi:peptide deformylase
MVTIVQSENKVLRKISKEVPLLDIKKPKIKKILAEMNTALDSQYDGVAIAAPQIGVSLRIFIISGRVFDEDFIRGTKPIKQKVHKNLVFINPVFKKISKDRKLMSEGCLSVRPVYGKVRRATRATVEAYNEKAEKFTMDGSGLIAHIFQHESDHLDGILFIDKAKDLHDSYPEKEYK